VSLFSSDGLGLGLARCGLGLSPADVMFVVKHGFVTLVIVMILKDTATVQVQLFSFKLELSKINVI